MPSVLETLHSFDLATAAVSIWAFKKSSAPGRPVSFNGHWIGTTDALDDAIREAIDEARAGITEEIEYGILAQNNESSVLVLTTLETHAGLIIQKTIDETEARKVSDLKHLRNATFYVLKLVNGEEIIYAVRKTDDSWISKRAGGQISAIFSDDELDLNLNPSFNISKYVDFFIVGDNILVRSKGAFESVLNYKQTHLEDFSALQSEPEFINVFSSTAPIVQYVGDNKIQLRRASAIREKAHYRNPDFMSNLRSMGGQYGLNIQFGLDGKINPTPETCPDIFRALLDHRLTSPFSRGIYNVEDASNI
ncbi:Kiwa anti-phage protein KwaB-like domain-containing protein [uncultured Herbaspirillum sp.]|uniref:Kiwa anti-phage protein KwaB-like domain-containing protein n=1 Tax=uncultured Herbaspirillum sp. TaxID=160236 RepID=UPI0025910449|nr:Kiwa anti-phage protein KwaB-like domain-containing protein [uncultured Herbaspirillum sp.]